MSEIFHSVIVCTQGRTPELGELLDCLNQIARTIPLELVVIANSKLERDNLQIVKVLDAYNEFSSKKYLISSPGLPRSRNMGKKISQGKYLTFLDDDVEITLSYFHTLEKMFESDDNLVGIAPYIEIDPIVWNSGQIQRKKRLRCRRGAGTISGFGKFSWIEFAESNKEVEWLPGCVMSYRRCTLEFLEFNQDLENGITGGYALGEDADFSMRVAKTGKLVGLASEAVLHKLSPISRASLEQMELARGAWFAYLTRNFPSKFKKRKIFLVLVLNSIAVFLGLRPRSGLTRLSFVTASLRIKGFVNEKKKPNLIAESPR